MLQHRIRRATILDCLWWNELRPEDIRELVDSVEGDMPAWKIVAKSIELSDESWVAYEKDTGNPIILFGVCQNGIIWAVATPLIKQYAKPLFRVTRKIFERWLGLYPQLHSFVDARNVVHKDWLQRMGFVFPGMGQTINGYHFEYFIKEK
jgi:hypothetical protein